MKPWTDLNDRSIVGPDGDLLNVAQDAEVLAGYLAERATFPFTLGIYGAWGEGKTTFANLLIHYLCGRGDWSSTRIIRFSAWPYVGADEIWRALLRDIARAALNVDPNAPEKDSSVETPSGRARSWLLTKVLDRRRRMPSETRRTYDDLVLRLQRDSSIARRSIDEGVSARQMMQIASLAVEASSPTAPLNVLRRLASMGTELSQNVSDAQAVTVVESVEAMRSDLAALFARMSQSRFIILVDDLDRCLPEVALDVLETIKIFFFESSSRTANCLFIVAADERLIARGLRARLGEEHAQEAIQYLDKLVQLRVPVPEVGSVQVERLVGACFPEWVGAVDLISTGLGSNPRRVKQRCSVMSYQYKVKLTGEAKAAQWHTDVA